MNFTTEDAAPKRIDIIFQVSGTIFSAEWNLLLSLVDVSSPSDVHV